MPTIDQRVRALLKSEPTKSAVARVLLDEGYSKTQIAAAVPMNYSQVHSVDKKRSQEQTQDRARKNLANVDVGKMKPHEVLELAQKMDRSVKKAGAGRKAKPELELPGAFSETWGQSPKAPGKRTMKPVTSPILDAIKKGKPVDIGRITGRVGKLRVPGLPSDTAVGECANCGFDLVIRGTREGLVFTHVGASAEDYLNITQFCQAVPKVLIG